ncbi:MAG: ABC transporter substrate-binding protein [Acidimicrobiales bacterium]
MRSPLALVVSVLAMSTACGGVAEQGTARGSECVGARTAVSAPAPTPLSPAPTPVLPVTVADVSGAQVTVSDASRILALDTYGTLATTVYALGLGDRLIGRDSSTGVPALADLPVVTVDGHQLNAEAILGLRPSVVLTDYSIGPLEVQLQLRDAGIPVVVLDQTRSRATIGRQIEAVAEALGVADAGAALARRVTADVTNAERTLAERIERRGLAAPRMAFIYVRGNAGVYQWFGKDSGADALIRSLGGIDVASEAGVTGYRPLNAEGIVAAAPTLLLVMTDGLASVGGVDGLVAVPGIAETTAARNRCVVDMADSQILGFGPNYAGAVSALGDAIYGDIG